MESLYYVIAVLTAGVSLAIGLLNLITFFQKGREKLNLVFGILCLLVVGFILLPPGGFFLTDNLPNSASVILKRIFNLSFLGLFPWFIALYTGYNKKLL